MVQKPLFCLRPGLELFLASASPRREALLSSLGLPFDRLATAVREPAPAPGEDPVQYAIKLAAMKQAAGRALVDGRDFLILAADTIVVAGGDILGKPGSPALALRMLRKLNGRRHEAITAISIAAHSSRGLFLRNAAASATVHFGAWPDAVLAAYAATSEPLDKAGAYAIQGNGAFLVERIEGAWTTVVGLPLSLLAGILMEEKLIFPAGAKNIFCQS